LRQPLTNVADRQASSSISGNLAKKMYSNIAKRQRRLETNLPNNYSLLSPQLVGGNVLTICLFCLFVRFSVC